MAPPISESKIALSYPLYTCDFDPQDTTRLICGGGGGAGRSGVGNKITVVDTSHDPIQVSAEVELSRDEDNVTSLAVGQRRNGKATLVYAGINSGSHDQQKGKNEHFRVFAVDPNSKAKSVIGPKIAELSRSSLFSTGDADAYQRLLRISPPGSAGAQVGAIATGLAKDAQIAIFDVAAGSAVAPKLRSRLDIAKEALDLDIIQTSEDAYQLAYCDDYELYVVDITKKGISDPENVYTIAHDDSGSRPSFRSLRYLTPSFVLATMNLPRRGGVLLQGFRLPAGTQSKARIAVNTRLPRAVTQSTGLAVANLSPAPTSPPAKQGDAQFVIAVAGHDFSVSLYTLDHQAVGDVDLIVNLFPLRTLRAVHHGYITALAFAPFAPPRTPTARVQHLRLASVSVANTVAVHGIPLRKLLDRSAASSSAGKAAAKRAGPPRQPRYVVAIKSQAPSATRFLLAVAAGFLLLGLLLQGVLEVKGLTRPIIGARGVVPASWRADLPARYQQQQAPPALQHEEHGASSPLAELLAEKKLESGDSVVLVGEEAAVDGAEGSRVETHEESTHGPARTWEELPPEQKSLWRERLKAGGHWAEGMGETLFKGVLFSELAGAVGAAVGG